VLAAIEAVPNMAATQSEPQQNEVNRENVQQDQCSVSENSSLQNGTDRNSSRGLLGFDGANPKVKSSSQNIVSAEMSQYRQDPGVGSGIHNPDPSSNSEDLSKANHCENKQFSHNEQSDPNYVKSSPDNGSQTMPGSYGLPFAQRGNYHLEHSSGSPLQPGGENNIHQPNFGPFNPQMRHAYAAPKPGVPGPGTPVPQRPLSSSPNMTSGNYSPHLQQQQQRFLSGQSISQPTGPTPTLNQLLQSSNPVHRYQNSYVDYSMGKQGGDQNHGNMPYSQPWPPRPMAPYAAQPGLPGYRPQAQVVSAWFFVMN